MIHMIAVLITWEGLTIEQELWLTSQNVATVDVAGERRAELPLAGKLYTEGAARTMIIDTSIEIPAGVVPVVNLYASKEFPELDGFKVAIGFVLDQPATPYKAPPMFSNN